ncbi:homocitrate synthase [Mycobacterium kansasii]|nr:homocitrate synthase [Mycobacterium kansasii]
MTIPLLNPTATNTTSQRRTANAWFADQFGTSLPRGLRELAEAMSWEGFVATYGHSSGPLRLVRWTNTDAARPATRLGPQARNFRAMIAVNHRISKSTAVASGPYAALTAMLHDRGIAVETLKFHQIQRTGRTATFIYGSDGSRAEWAMGWSEGSTQSALRALIACANRLNPNEGTQRLLSP